MDSPDGGQPPQKAHRPEHDETANELDNMSSDRLQELLVNVQQRIHDLDPALCQESNRFLDNGTYEDSDEVSSGGGKEYGCELDHCHRSNEEVKNRRRTSGSIIHCPHWSS